MSDVNKLDELEALLAKAAQGEWTMHSEPEVGLPPMLFAADTSKIYGNLTPIEPLIYDDLAAIVAAVNWCRDEGIALARQSVEQATRLAAAYATLSAALTELALGNGPSLEAYDRGIAEGERRATAALVAWLRDDAADGKTQFQLARAIRRGDHLKGTSNE